MNGLVPYNYGEGRVIGVFILGQDLVGDNGVSHYKAEKVFFATSISLLVVYNSLRVCHMGAFVR